MANWLRKMDISKEFRKCEEGEMSFNQLCTAIAEKLSALEDTGLVFIDSEKNHHIESFRRLAETQDPEGEGLDGYLDQLYNWGDYFHGNYRVCFIKTS